MALRQTLCSACQRICVPTLSRRIQRINIQTRSHPSIVPLRASLLQPSHNRTYDGNRRFITTSSYCQSTSGDQSIGQLDSRMAIIFTCKVCNSRQTKTFSKKSYTEGVVIIQCDGCKNRHLIADNLGWFTDVDGR